MSVCPVPAKSSSTDYSNPGSFIATAPDAKFEVCEGGTSSTIGPGNPVVTTVCCPAPGPMGPAGEKGCGLAWMGVWVSGGAYHHETGTPICSTSMVTHNGVTYIAKTQHTAAADSEPGVGANWATNWDIFATGTAGAMVWKGDWLDGVAYKEHDVVRNTIYDTLVDKHEGFGNAYVCVADHTSSLGSNPPPDPAYWAPATDVGAAVSDGDKSFLSDLKDSVFDWIKNAVDNGEWIKLLAAGVGVATAGALIVDMFTQDGSGDGNADSRYDGTAAYNGAYTAPTLQSVVSSIMTYGGYSSGQFDVSLLPAKEVHFTIANTMSLRNLLGQLALAYQFDIVPSGGLVKFVPKYQTSVRTLTYQDFGHKVTGGSDVSPNAPYTMKRMQGIDLPRSVTLNYYSANIDHNVFSQTASLETFEEGQDVKLDVPFTMTDEEAHRIAETALVNTHIEQQQITFTTDYYNLDLEPGDIVTIPLDSGGTMDVRIIQVTSTDDGILEFTAVRSDYNTSSYTASGVTPSAPPTQTTNVVASIGYSSALFIEVPHIAGESGSPRVFSLIHGYGAAGWPGAVLYRSIDSGASYSPVATSSSIVTMGIMNSISAAPAGNNYHIWDDQSELVVTLKQGSLISASSDLAVQNGDNWCMVGEEVIGFRYAQLIGANQYKLTRLLRGRAGTEVKINDHVADELFVLLDQSRMTRLDISTADLGKTVKFKAVTFGSDLSKATAIDVKPYGLNMRPLRPANAKAEKQANGDWLITWIERPRMDNNLRDYTELTHDVDWAGFAVAIKQGSTIKRTATAVTNSFVYTVAMQTADFGGVQTSLEAQVVQMSTVVGGGYAAEIVA